MTLLYMKSHAQSTHDKGHGEGRGSGEKRAEETGAHQDRAERAERDLAVFFF